MTVACQFDERSAIGRIVLTPNRSATWRANLCVVATLSAVPLAAALGLSASGFWLILGFAVLQSSVLLACLYVCARRTHTVEVLVLSQDRLLFERGVRRPTLERAFERYFSRFIVEPPRRWSDRRRVALAHRGEVFEVGRFLGDEDRQALITALRRIIHRLETSPAWRRQ